MTNGKSGWIVAGVLALCLWNCTGNSNSDSVTPASLPDYSTSTISYAEPTQDVQAVQTASEEMQDAADQMRQQLDQDRQFRQTELEDQVDDMRQAVREEIEDHARECDLMTSGGKYQWIGC